MNNVIVRFAPSPTGMLHIGNARTALFNYLFAKKNNGKFLLRIEDTDKSRSTKEAINAIINGLDWLGINYDDKPIFQSQNQQNHIKIALKLLEEGKAYYCYTSKEELKELRESAKKNNSIFRFQSPWRNKFSSQLSSVKPVIRLKVQKNQYLVINDLIQGEIKISTNEIDDFVILRDDNSPTYNLSVVIDDYNMNITHVIRGDDHLVNSFKQKVVYDMLNWKIPFFAHLPLIHNNDGSKMSKRQFASSVTEYEDMGYIPAAVRNYLLRLGWSYGNKEVISDEDAIRWFDISDVNKSPARFDINKLNNLNKIYIKQTDNSYLFRRIMEIDKKNKYSKHDEIRIKKSIELLKTLVSDINSLHIYSSIYKEHYLSSLTIEDQNLISKHLDKLKKVVDFLKKIRLWEIDIIKENLKYFLSENNMKMKDIALPIRIALTYSSKSPGGLFNIIEILGKEITTNRIKYFIGNEVSL